MKLLGVLNTYINVPISNIGIHSLFCSCNWKYSTEMKILICRANNLIFYTYFNLQDGIQHITHMYISLTLQVNNFIWYIFCEYSITISVAISLPIGSTMCILTRNLVVPAGAEAQFFVESGMQMYQGHYKLMSLWSS